MKVTLVSSAGFTCNQTEAGRQNFSVGVTFTLGDSGQVDDETKKEFEKLKRDINGHWTLTGGVIFYENDDATQLMDVSLEGELFQKLHQLLFDGDADESLKIVAKFHPMNQHESKDESLKVEANEMVAGVSCGSDDRGGDGHLRYGQRRVVMPPDMWDNANYYYGYGASQTWYITVELSVKPALNLNAFLPKVSDKNAKMLKDKLHCDFEIVAVNGVSVPCHKAILSVNSPVFLSKCEGKLKESAPNKMTMELTEDAVNALLEFMYCGNVEKPLANSAIALELFQAGHEYDISDLERIMEAILLKKSDEWYHLDTALLLFQFLVNYQGEYCPKLKRKVIRVLAKKPFDELSASEVYQEMFTTPAVREMFALSLKM